MKPCYHSPHEQVTWTAAWEDGEPVMVCSKGGRHGLLSPTFSVYEVALAFYQLGKEEAALTEAFLKAERRSNGTAHRV